MTNEPKKISRGVARVAFLARLDDLCRLLDAGHSLRSIYNNFAEELGVGYPQFTKYVSKYIKKKTMNLKEGKSPLPKPLQETEKDKHGLMHLQKNPFITTPTAAMSAMILYNLSSCTNRCSNISPNFIPDTFFSMR